MTKKLSPKIIVKNFTILTIAFKYIKFKLVTNVLYIV